MNWDQTMRSLLGDDATITRDGKGWLLEFTIPTATPSRAKVWAASRTRAIGDAQHKRITALRWESDRALEHPAVPKESGDHEGSFPIYGTVPKEPTPTPVNDAKRWPLIREEARKVALEAFGMPGLSDDTKLHGLTFGTVVHIAARAAVNREAAAEECVAALRGLLEVYVTRPSSMDRPVPAFNEANVAYVEASNAAVTAARSALARWEGK